VIKIEWESRHKFLKAEASIDEKNPTLYVHGTLIYPRTILEWGNWKFDIRVIA
jgi:hypothetical protein